MALARKFSSGLIVLSIFALDRLTKAWVVGNMFLGESIPILPFFHITYVENTGIAFGVGRDRNVFFTVLSLILLIALLALRHSWEKKYPGEWKLKVGLSLVIAGALGNLYDRIAHGSVIDFLDFFAGGWHWPAFNVADSAICIGAALLAWSQWTRPQDPQSPPTT